MVIKNSFFMDNTSNTLRIDPIDDDGFHVCEIAGGDKIYVYYSEIDDFIACLKKIKDEMLEGIL